MKRAAILLLLLLGQIFVGAGLQADASAHLTGGTTKIVGKYIIQFLVLPKNPLPDENATLNFSVQDLKANNLRNVTATITVTLRNVTVFFAPRNIYAYGDFLLGFVFPQEGTYVLTIVVFDAGQSYPAEFDIVVSRFNRLMVEITQRAAYIVWFAALLVLFVLLARELRKNRRQIRVKR